MRSDKPVAPRSLSRLLLSFEAFFAISAVIKKSSIFLSSDSSSALFCLFFLALINFVVPLEIKGELSNAKINAYPNPFIDYTKIVIENLKGPFEVSIYDMYGRIVIEERLYNQ